MTFCRFGMLAILSVCLLMSSGESGARDLKSAIKEKRDQAVGVEMLSYKGEERSYIVYVPLRFQRDSVDKKVPAVIVLHGGGGDAQSAERMTGFSKKASQEGFIAVYPNGTARIKDLQTWNAWHCCGYAMKKNIDDVGFISALIDHLIATQPVDPDRIFVTGMSNGGMMSHRMGVDLAGKVAGIAPVVGGLFGDEVMPNVSVPAIIINGQLDNSVPVDGGAPGGRFTSSWDGHYLKPAEYQGNFWAKNNGCSGDAHIDTSLPNVIVRTYDCPASAPVKHYIVMDNGHAWPSGKKGSSLGDDPSTSLNATDLIWDFFKSLP